MSNRIYHVMGQLAKESIPYLGSAMPGAYLAPDWGQPATQYAYDTLGRIIQVTRTDGTAVVAGYNSCGHIRSWMKTVINAATPAIRWTISAGPRIYGYCAIGQPVCNHELRL